MGEKICETIPFKNFRDRIRITKEYLRKGIVPQNLDSCLLIDYTIDLDFDLKEDFKLCDS